MSIALDAVLAGLIANAFTSLLGKLGRAIGDDLDVDGQQGALAAVLEPAIERLAEEFEWPGPGRLEEVCLFLASAEAESIVRQLYASRLANGSQEAHLDSIRSEFANSLAVFVGESLTEVQGPANVLFGQLVAASEDAMTAAVEGGILSAHEAKSTFRHRVLLDELAAIQKRIECVARRPESTLSEILSFEEGYRRQVAERHGYIVPPHFDSAKRYPIDRLYVCPRFSLLPESRELEAKELPMYDFIGRAHRCVVLSSPGGGKSTLASRLCYDLATRYKERLFCHRHLTPVYVVLREYGAAKRQQSCSLLDFIEAAANARYQLRPPTGAFEYLLLHGRALVILDGLDELVDTSYRREISADIESFCNLYPETPVLVTSRQVGYEQAPLAPERFQTAQLAPFDEPRIREYVQNWFNSAEDLPPDERKALTEGFLEESEIVRDLCSNPLMLALVCTIYRGERYIPRNRPEVYEKCAVMLFERWDKSRGIAVPLPFEAHIGPAMTFLAHWIYAEPSLQSGVTESDLVGKAAEYLAQKRFEDEDEAKHAARQFIDFCRGRAWVFTDTGTTACGERLYQFTHRTFLEYFAASYLVRTNVTPARLGRVLFPRIARSEWDVVAQLAFQLQNKNVEGAADKLLTDLMRQSEKRKRGAWNLLGFAGRCLEFLVPSPNVVRDITEAGVRRWIEHAARGGDAASGRDFVATLSRAANENAPVVAKSLEATFLELIRGPQDDLAARAAEACMSIELVWGPPRSMECAASTRTEWCELCHRVIRKCSDRIAESARKDFGVCLLSFFNGHWSVDTLVHVYGLDALWFGYTYKVYPQFISGSACARLVAAAFRPDLHDWPQAERALCTLADTVAGMQPPWFEVGRRDRYYADVLRTLLYVADAAEKMRMCALDVKGADPHALFSVFAICAAEVELCGEENLGHLRAIATSSPALISRLARALVGRHEQLSDEQALVRVSELGLKGKEANLAARWLRGEISFTKRRKELPS